MDQTLIVSTGPEIKYRARLSKYGARLNKYGARLNKFGARDKKYGARDKKYRARLSKYGARLNKYGARFSKYGARDNFRKNYFYNVLSQPPYMYMSCTGIFWEVCTCTSCDILRRLHMYNLYTSVQLAVGGVGWGPLSIAVECMQGGLNLLWCF
jgi:hypothetical protein